MKSKDSGKSKALTLRDALSRSSFNPHLFADSAEGIRVPRSRKAVQDVSAGMRQMFAA
jgi:hypothetical protein